MTYKNSISLLALLTSATLAASSGGASAGGITDFTVGDLVIDTVTNSTSLSNADALDTASPMTLDEFSLGAGGTTASSVGTLTLPQTTSGANSAISGEYGSASEGLLQLSGNGRYLTIMGYGVNASTFNTAPCPPMGPPRLARPPA